MKNGMFSHGIDRLRHGGDSEMIVVGHVVGGRRRRRTTNWRFMLDRGASLVRMRMRKRLMTMDRCIRVELSLFTIQKKLHADDVDADNSLCFTKHTHCFGTQELRSRLRELRE